MKFEELIILLPCHSFEDFPQHHEGEDADSLLASWTALWHPALVASAQTTPTWYRVDFPPDNVAQKLLVAPTVSVRELPTGFAQRVKEQGGLLIRKESNRNAIVTQALAALAPPLPDLSPDLVGDFHALGYCYLQIQLLTRQMRYSSNLDETHFRNQLVAAANSACQGQEDACREKLAACFNLLAAERDHYYSVDAYLLDLTLVAPTTLGDSLRTELQTSVPLNLMMGAALLQRLRDSDPATCERIRDLWIGGRLSILGGEWDESPLPLLSAETILGSLATGVRGYQSILGRQPEIYARRRFGLTPSLPTVLRKLGFRGCLHATLDDGQFPQGSQAKTRWQSPDGTTVDALARPPLDASKPETFLSLATRLGSSMDADHVATLVLAHWPARASVWYEDLRRCAKYGNAIGKFCTADRYFHDTLVPGQLDLFDADQYESPFLRQAVIRREADPISRWVRYWRDHARLESWRAMDVLTDLVANRASAADRVPENTIQTLQSDDGSPGTVRVGEQLETALAEFHTAFSRRSTGDSAIGYLVVNPVSFSRRVGVRLPQLSSPPAVGAPVLYASGSESGSGVEPHAVVELPPMGYVWLRPGGPPPREKRPPKPLAEGDTLRNEFFEAIIHPHTGALQAIRSYNTRGNRMSQQLALRVPAGQSSASRRDPADASHYSVMAADEIKIVTSTTTCGEITSRGRLLDREGRVQAKFLQRYQIWRGSRVLGIEIELEPVVEPEADPWNSYYACRFAWASEAASLWRATNDVRQVAEGKRLEAPLYLDIDDDPLRTTVLTGGLPYHRRCGHRMLDTLLIVRGETCRRFQLGIGVDLPQPYAEALSLLAPPPVSVGNSPQGSFPSHAWFFHIDARNVVATHWSLRREEGKVVGFRVRLLETAGRPVQVRLKSYQPLLEARQVDFQGNSLGNCRVEDGTATLELAASEWLEVEARWS